MDSNREFDFKITFKDKFISCKNKSLIKEKLGYVPSLDGLRGIAVILVLLTHANFQLGHNGIIGVYLFFALSGFLITTLILEEKEGTGKFSFQRFYLKRFKRLFPALVVLLIVVFIYSLIITDNLVRYSLWEEITGSLFYVYNIMWVWGWGGESSLLAHSWSLAVEEQFYFLWPFLLISCYSFLSKKSFVIFSFLFLIISMIFKELAWASEIYGVVIQESIFFGCLAGMIRIYFPKSSVGVSLSLILLVGIIVAGIFPSDFIQKTFIGSFSGIIGLFTSIIILGLVGNPNSKLSIILSNSALVFVGKISYSLYLWHVPVFKWFKEYSPYEPWKSFLFKFIVTFLISYLSWLIVETRFREKGRKLSKNLVAV